MCRRELWLLLLLLRAGIGWGPGSQGLDLSVTVARSFPFCVLFGVCKNSCCVLPSWEGEEKLAGGRAGTQVLGRSPCHDLFQVWCSLPVEGRVRFECRTGLKQLRTLFTTHLRPGATSRLPFTSCCDFKKKRSFHEAGQGESVAGTQNWGGKTCWPLCLGSSGGVWGHLG